MNWFNNLSISKKIQFGFISVISFSILVGLYSTLSVGRISKETQKMFDNPYTSVKSILTIKSDITKIHSLMQEVAATNDIQNIQRISNEIDGFQNNVFEEFKLFGESYDGNRDDFQKLKLSFIDSKPIRDEILNLSLAGMEDIATRITNNEGIQSVNQLNETIDLLLTYSQNSAEKFVLEAKQTSTIILIINIIALILLLIISLYIGNVTTKSIVNPVKKIEEAALSLSQGNLDATLTDFHNDEIGVLANSISDTIHILNSYITEISYILSEIAKGNMIVSVEGDYKGSFLPIKNALNEISNSLNSTLHSINIASSAVADSATNLNNQAFILSQSVEKQAKDINKFSSFIKDISIQSKENQSNAEEANSFVLQIKTLAENGEEKMQNMLSSMNEIKESSYDIDKIVRVIEDIAFQTTILSLNASIEATSAGVHGKGFAVIAQQVRALATKSSDAATQARELVANSISKSNQGYNAANETSVALEHIITGVTNAVPLIDNIFQSSTQQCLLVDGVVMIVNDINNEVAQNEQSAKQSAYESDALTNQAIVLKDRMDHFKLKEVQQFILKHDLEVCNK